MDAICSVPAQDENYCLPHIFVFTHFTLVLRPTFDNIQKYIVVKEEKAEEGLLG